jgi:hypothetical protein
MQVGMNLTAPSDWGRAWVWKDQMRQARWLAGAQPWWLIQWDHDKWPSGRWVLEWSGDDVVKVPHGGGKVDAVLPNLHVLNVTWPTKGMALAPFGDARDIHLWMPGVNRSGSQFHPEYTSSLEPFAVLRFMDWQDTNRTSVASWGVRRLDSDPQQWVAADGKGVAIEHCLALAAEVGADPWLCVPHLADDEYVRQLALLILDRLPSGRICYLELSNEFWNTAAGFAAGRWFAAQAKALGVPPAQVYGARVKQIARIVRPILGDRVKIVLCGQAANAWQVKTAAAAAGAGNYDAISCSWYFYTAPGWIGTHDHTVSDVLDACQTYVDGKLVADLKSHADLARQLGVPLVLYEGGQHLTAGATSPIADEVLAAQRHPRMGDLYRAALARCREAGATIVLGYSDVSPWAAGGSWGLREHQTDYDSPKWRALVEAAAP